MICASSVCIDASLIRSCHKVQPISLMITYTARFICSRVLDPGCEFSVLVWGWEVCWLYKCLWRLWRSCGSVQMLLWESQEMSSLFWHFLEPLGWHWELSVSNKVNEDNKDRLLPKIRHCNCCWMKWSLNIQCMAIVCINVSAATHPNKGSQADLCQPPKTPTRASELDHGAMEGSGLVWWTMFSLHHKPFVQCAAEKPDPDIPRGWYCDVHRPPKHCCRPLSRRWASLTAYFGRIACPGKKQ